MAGLLSGLEQFGLNNMENMNLYETNKKGEEGGEEGKPVQTVQEQDFLFDKSYTCPLCDREFKARTVKIGKARLAGSDLDLRPRYEQIDLLKYDVIMCPSCGYTSLSRFFKYLTSPQAKNIQKTISATFKPQKETAEVYTYDEALERYKLALANAIVKQTKASEKAYICLKTAWLLRGKAEHLDPAQPDYEEQKKKCQEQEDEFLRNALEGFLAARQTESFPMCGMDEPTVDYVISVTAMRFEQYDVASRLISNLVVSKTANPRMKDKARDVKEMLMKKIKEKNAANRK